MAWYPADLERRWREGRLKQRQPVSETEAADRPPSNVPASTSGGNPSSDPSPEYAVSESTPGAEARGRRPTGCCLCNLRRLWNPAAGQGRQQPAAETEAANRTTGNVPDSTGGGSPPRDPLPINAPASESTSDAGSTIIRSPPPEPAPAPDADTAGPSTSAKDSSYSGILSPTCEPTWLVPD